MEIATHFATLLLGTALGAWYNAYLKRPRLKLTGGGSGGGPGPGHHKHSVRITNQPGLLGVRLDETVIMGKRIHGTFEKGLTVDRNPANECTASLHDKQTERHVALLWWRPTGDATAAWQQIATIQSGESFDLMLFARLDSEPTKYFVFAPESESASSPPRVPNDEAKFTDTRAFFVRVAYSYGRQKLSFDVTVQKEFDGRLSWQTDAAGGSF